MATESNKNRVAYEFNPFKKTGIRVQADRREEALEAVSEFVKESVLDFVGSGRSPVAKGKWRKGLSKGYKSVKAEQSSVRFSNLELTGEMLDSLDARVKGNTVIVGIEDDQAGKADGNNRGTYGGKGGDKFKREFIPKRGQTFRKIIMDGVRDILRGIRNEP